MTSEFAISGPRILIFDTGPILELIIYSAARNHGFQSLRRKLRFLNSYSKYQNFTDFVGTFHRRMTTPHVVSEISFWIARNLDKGQSDVWSLVYRNFEAMGMDEELLKLLEMPRKLVVSFGAVDISVFELAKKHKQGNPLVLSIDGALIAECRRAGLKAMHLCEVIEDG